MRGRILTRKFYEVDKDLVMLFKKIAFPSRDIVFGTRSRKEGIKHHALTSKSFETVVILNADNIVKLDPLYIGTYVLSGKNRLTRTRVAYDKAQIYISRIKGVFVVIDIRLRYQYSIIGLDQALYINLKALVQCEEHTRNSTPVYLFGIVIGESLVPSRKLQILTKRPDKLCPRLCLITNKCDIRITNHTFDIYWIRNKLIHTSPTPPRGSIDRLNRFYTNLRHKLIYLGRSLNKLIIMELARSDINKSYRCLACADTLLNRRLTYRRIVGQLITFTSEHHKTHFP